ncbi:MAG: peroxiredoxin [Xanthomonadales bacterium]|nr:peroxiredoxin [Xanthomonadales bacterium]
MSNSVPQVNFMTRVRDESIDGDNPFRWQPLSSNDIFAGKKIVLFALPGAFTPTCSTSHLPGYEANFQALQDQGVDEVWCLSVNDAFVMYQWGLSQKTDNVRLLPDGSGDFSRLMGMLVKKDNVGFGPRSWRYSMFVEDGVISKMFSEAGIMDDAPADPFEVSDADTMLNWLKNR